MNDTYRKDEKITTNFEPSNDEDLMNKAYLDKNSSEIEGHVTFTGKEFNDFKFLSNKQSTEEVLIQKAVKAIIQTLFDKGLFHTYDKTDEVIKCFFCLLKDVDVIWRK